MSMSPPFGFKLGAIDEAGNDTDIPNPFRIRVINSCFIGCLRGLGPWQPHN